jgi:hypothetical protein
VVDPVTAAATAAAAQAATLAPPPAPVKPLPPPQQPRPVTSVTNADFARPSQLRPDRPSTSAPLGAGGCVGWSLEHAFERNKAANRAVDDAQLRIFMVLVVFATGFMAVAMGATNAALFSRPQTTVATPRPWLRPAPTWWTATAGCWRWT